MLALLFFNLCPFLVADTRLYKRLHSVYPLSLFNVEIFNKAGYTATSCGQVGRGGNARFPTFRLVSTDGPTDGPMDGRTKPLIELRVRN